MLEARINPYHTIASMWDRLRCGLNGQTAIPTRSALDDPATFNAASRECLGMKSHLSDTRNLDGRAYRPLELIREGDAHELISPAFKFGPFGTFLEAALPRCIRCREHPLQRMTRQTQLRAVIGE